MEPSERETRPEGVVSAQEMSHNFGESQTLPNVMSGRGAGERADGPGDPERAWLPVMVGCRDNEEVEVPVVVGCRDGEEAEVPVVVGCRVWEGRVLLFEEAGASRAAILRRNSL